MTLLEQIAYQQGRLDQLKWWIEEHSKKVDKDYKKFIDIFEEIKNRI